jgi:phosphoribosylglycinamide formyltransferase-1
MMIRLAIFASGSGSNAENIFHSFKNNDQVEVQMLVCNKAEAGVWNRFKNTNIQKVLISKSDLESKDFLSQLNNIDYIILAGFLLKIPSIFIEKFPSKIINVHPSLLPKFGGKGMYGAHVHRAVLEAKEIETGITIHLVDEEFDHGRHLFQVSFPIISEDNLESIQSKINALEMEFYPKVIEEWVKRSLCDSYPD